jgi:predicted homoserine dehydrogenase-like protein
MGRSIAIGSDKVDGVDVTAVADIRLDHARETFTDRGYESESVATVSTVAEADAALADGKFVVTEDAFLLPKADEIDVVIAATGVPEIGAKVATRGILNDTHVVMLTDETDAVIGPYLSAMAAQSGVVYSGAAGDEPGAIMEVYDFADSLGFDIVAAGKGKNNPLDREATPEKLEAEAKEKDLNPEIYTAFVDGTNSMLEMTMVANATGMTVDTRGMHGPEVSDVEELAEVFNSDTGILEQDGVVDFALGGGVAPGVFLVVTTDNDVIREDLDYLKMGDGPNYVLHRTYHIPTIEPLLTAARAELYGDASLVPQEPVVDTISIAKRDLSPGETIDGIGGSTVYGLTEDADVAKEGDFVPISVIEGATVVNDISKGEEVTYDDVELPESELLYLRKLQDSYFE